ncbi:MAG: cytochrome c [Gammaproteobacteria bacterium]|nr:cytochrome c [Gammaproteobacteria bacterium]
MSFERSTKLLSHMAALLLALFSVPALAQGDATRGADLADTCKGCHFIPNYKNAYPVYKVPKIGGQNEEYILAALKGYISGERTHPTMTGQAATLNDQDLLDVAAYLASLGAPRTQDATSPVSDKIATCSACHGERGISAMGMYPNLAGQHHSYLEQALASYRNGTRKNPIMTGFAGALSEDDIKVIAAYFSAQKGLFTPAL